MPASDEQNAWTRRVLGVSLPQAGGAGAEYDLDDLGLDMADLWKAARTAFDRANADVDRQIAALQVELRQSNDEELEEIADSGLNALTGNTRVPLVAALIEAGPGDPAQVRAAAPKLTRAIAAFRAHIEAPG